MNDPAFRVSHATEYAYAEPVTASLHHAVLALRNTDHQSVRCSQIIVEPEPRSLVTTTDYFGNQRSRFNVETKATHLRVDAESEVVLRPGPSPDVATGLSLADLRGEVRRAAIPADLQALEFIFESHYVPRSERLADYAARSFSANGSFLAGVVDLMHRIYSEFTYDEKVTDISTPVEDVLTRRGGVCQDFAHLMIGCLRALGIPTRYVSGYLVPLPGVVGAQASHAWVSVYSPGTGWVDFDPTNDVIPSTGHITVGWGRDFADVSPLRGVMLGGGSHTVHVEVRVVPTNLSNATREV